MHGKHKQVKQTVSKEQYVQARKTQTCSLAFQLLQAGVQHGGVPESGVEKLVALRNAFTLAEDFQNKCEQYIKEN